MSDPNVPAVRSDEIGKLAWRLLGIPDEEIDPDLTAAVPLCDELLAQGDTATAVRLRQEIGQLWPMCANFMASGTNQRQRAVRDLQQQLGHNFGFLLWDFASTCGLMAKFVADANTAEEIQQGKVELDTVKMRVTSDLPVGFHIRLDDGRGGVVVSARDAEGFVNIVIQDDNAMSDGGMDPGMPMMPGPRAQRFYPR